MTGRRGNFPVFVPTVVVLAGAAFGAGSYLRVKEPPRVTVQPTRLAQATQTGSLGGSAAHGVTNARPGDGDADSAHRTFETVYNHVKQYYVDRLPGDRAMSYGAIRAMLSSLNDPNCYFLEPDQYRLILSETEGKFSGIGASLSVRPTKHDGYTDYKLTVVSPLPGSPAERAGLKSGDIITHVDGRWVLGYDPYLKANKMADRLKSQGTEKEEDELRREFESAQRKDKAGLTLLRAQMTLRGDQSTLTALKLAPEKRVLTVQRSGVTAPLQIEMTTGETEAPAVATRRLGDDVAYIRVPSFTSKTAAEVKAALANLAPDSGLVLDLRGNPGGLLDAAMDVDAQLSPGTGKPTFGFEMEAGGKLATLSSDSGSDFRRPIVVLVDRGTASVAEALAASLADKGNATILGSKTFGDATVQMAFALPDGAAFVLNTGRMLSPRRVEWANAGLSPKVAVGQDADEAQYLNKAVAVLKSTPRVASSPTNLH